MNALCAELDTILRDGIFGLINSRVFPRSLRSRAWRALGHHVDQSALINPLAFVGAWHGLEIGKNTFVNYGCFFDLGAPTYIGERCDIGYEVMFVTTTHAAGPDIRRAGAPLAAPIRVGSGVWIGARVIILPGVTIGDGCIIAAGSLVSRDCEPNGLYVGSPARRSKDLAV